MGKCQSTPKDELDASDIQQHIKLGNEQQKNNLKTDDQKIHPESRGHIRNISTNNNDIKRGSGGQINHSSSTRNLNEFNSDLDQAPTKKEIAIYLRNVPLFNKLSQNDRDTLGEKVLKVKNFKSGTVITKEGDAETDFIIIRKGKAIVSKLDENKKPQEQGRLGEADYYGEKALLTEGKTLIAMNTVTAVSDVIALTVDRSKFHEMFSEKFKEQLAAHRAAVSAETYSKEDEKKHMTHEPSTKTPEKRKMILDAVKQNMLFRNLSPQQQDAVVDRMWLKECKKGQSVIKQGELGDNFYVVDSGEFDIYVNGVKVVTRGPGTSFGELALMYNAPRAATVTATVDSALWAVDRWTYRRLLTESSDKRLREYEQFLKSVKLFIPLSDSERSKISEALEEANFQPNHHITKQGEDGDTFFILREGECVCTMKDELNPDVGKEINRYHAGDYFGERALIKNQPRAATITTVGPVQVLYLNRQAFSQLLGPLEDILHKRVESYSRLPDLSPRVGPSSPRSNSDAKMPAIPNTTNQTTTDPAAERERLSKSLKLADLKVIGTLGKGSFGHVQLVKDPYGKTHALKTVSKQQIVQLGQQEHIMSEKRVMAALDHPFLVRLNATFKDKNFLYFLLEPSLGGELFSVLRAKTFFDEETARFFSASVVLAFEYMHSKDFIYRDLKPENLLLDENGYLKITDFGFAKKVKDRTWTLCGTPDYLAPEVVSGQGHGKGVDWWTLGILIYEMLASYPPFYDEDPMKTYAKIMHGHVAFPMHFSKAAIDLIKCLLHPKPTKRLGVIKGGAALIKSHPWFKGFDWDLFLTRKLAAPIKNTIRDPEDLSNFEKYPDEEMQYEEYVVDPKNPDWDKDF